MRPARVLWVLVIVLLLSAVSWHLVSRVREKSAPVSPISYGEVEDVCAGFGELTAAQRQDFLTRIVGLKVMWSGVVEDVDREHVVFVDIDGFFYDVRFRLPRDSSLKLKRGQTITFVGFIQEVESFLATSCRVVLRDVSLEPRPEAAAHQ